MMIAAHMPPTATYPASAQPGDSIMFAHRTSHSSDNNISPGLLHLDNWFIATQRDQTNTKIRKMNNMTILTLDTWHSAQLFQNIERGCWIIKGAAGAGPDYDITDNNHRGSRNGRGRCCISDLSPGAPVCNYVGRGRQCSVTHQGPRSMVRWPQQAPGAVPVCGCAGCAVGVGWLCIWDLML